jgi:PTH1 family peptidyl-tRNA hydrolase
MNWIIVGLGNPGEEYENSRHNIGWEILNHFGKELEWEHSKNAPGWYTHTKIGKEAVELLKPTTFMNKSGKAVGYAVTKHKIKPEHIVVVHDDLDLPLGKIRIVFGRGSGGHKGVESVKRAVKTNEFTRVRVGIVKSTPKGKTKKPVGDEAVQKFVLGKFSPAEERELKKVLKNSVEALETIIKEGRAKAMNRFN